MLRSRSKPTSIFQVLVVLQEIEPAVWRRLLVPADIKLHRLDRVIQEAMGWTNSHLHRFNLRDRTFSNPSFDETGELEFEDERKVALNALVGVDQRLQYLYDFGDCWRHQVLVEKVLEVDPRLHYPLCIAGARACPPEDCGGPGGYAQLLTKLANADHEEHDDCLTWVGGAFDPEGFDLNLANKAIWALRP